MQALQAQRRHHEPALEEPTDILSLKGAVGWLLIAVLC